MKVSIAKKISTWVLWFCMIITGCVFGVFYYKYNYFEVIDADPVLIWLYILLGTSFICVFLFLFILVIPKWKNNSKLFFSTILGGAVPVGILGVSFLLGNGNPLNISGYNGSDNTYYWLKIADMWLYSLYILLGLGVLAIFVGILWSYLKKTR